MQLITKTFILPFVVSVWVAWSMGAHAQTGLRAEVHKSLAAAQEALNGNQAAQALRLVSQVAVVPALTPIEQQSIWRLQAVAALRVQQWDLAIERLEDLLGLTDTVAADRLILQEMLVNALVQKKDAVRTIRVARDYLQAGGTHAEVRTALLQSLNLKGEHQALIREMNLFIQQDQTQGRKTPEGDLRLMGAASLKVKDDVAYFNVLKQLLRAYPSKAYWADAIVRLTSLPQFSNRYELDAYRLLIETGNMEEAAEYVEMATLAMKAGLPAEALRVLELGQAQGVIGKGAEASAHARLLAEARKKSQEDDALLPQLEAGAKDGNAWVAVADAQASKLNWAAAVVAYDKAKQAGGLRREAEANLHHGVALFKAGQAAAARSQWQAVRGDGTAQELASLWALLAH